MPGQISGALCQFQQWRGRYWLKDGLNWFSTQIIKTDLNLADYTQCPQLKTVNIRCVTHSVWRGGDWKPTLAEGAPPATRVALPQTRTSVHATFKWAGSSSVSLRQLCDEPSVWCNPAFALRRATDPPPLPRVQDKRWWAAAHYKI